MTMPCAAAFGRTQHFPDSTTAIFLRSCSLPVPLFENQISLEMSKILRPRRNSRECDEIAALCPKTEQRCRK